ncbi:hypothetical protein [Paraburkholderia sp.]|jgi:hypothetical protein|uniref:hypothetical protein n=1 Tax=Paraburkholderia sp. TaxID=1926495 RepID=UPI003C59527B
MLKTPPLSSSSVGPTCATLQGRPPSKTLRALRAQQVLLSDAYLQRVAVAASTDTATSLHD